MQFEPILELNLDLNLDFENQELVKQKCIENYNIINTHYKGAQDIYFGNKPIRRYFTKEPINTQLPISEVKTDYTFANISPGSVLYDIVEKNNISFNNLELRIPTYGHSYDFSDEIETLGFMSGPFFIYKIDKNVVNSIQTFHELFKTGKKIRNENGYFCIPLPFTKEFLINNLCTETLRINIKMKDKPIEAIEVYADIYENEDDYIVNGNKMIENIVYQFQNSNKISEGSFEYRKSDIVELYYSHPVFAISIVCSEFEEDHNLYNEIESISLILSGTIKLDYTLEQLEKINSAFGCKFEYPTILFSNEIVTETNALTTINFSRFWIPVALRINYKRVTKHPRNYNVTAISMNILRSVKNNSGMAYCR